MGKPLWDELEELADKLATEGKVSLPDLKTIRASAVQMANWFEACQETRQRLEALQLDNLKYRVALQTLNDVLGISAKYAGLEAREFGDDSFAKDLAPFVNIMVANGVEPYAKKKRVKNDAV